MNSLAEKRRGSEGDRRRQQSLVHSVAEGQGLLSAVLRLATRTPARETERAQALFGQGPRPAHLSSLGI